MDESPTRPRSEDPWLPLGGVLAAIAAASCCVVPFALFALGVSGAWIGALTGLSPYQPLFVVAAAGLIGVGLWRTYRRPAVRTQCADGTWCERPASSLLVRVVLWFGAGIVVLAMVFPYLTGFVLPS